MKRDMRMRPVLLTLSALAFLVMLGAPSHADKLKTLVMTLSGAIGGSGSDASAMAITFSGLNDQVNGSYVANPDGSLTVNGAGRTSWTLSYYFCDNKSHARSLDPCSNPDHDPWNYRRLLVKGGSLAGKGQPLLVVFPANSSWEIWRKARPGDPPGGVLEESGQLMQPATYQETVLR